MPIEHTSMSPDIAQASAPRSATRDWSALMAHAQDGDRPAYRALLGDITPYARALAARYFNEPLVIEDAVQDILLTVHAVRHAYDPRRPFGPWLVAIANRRIIDRLRRRMPVRDRPGIEQDAAAGRDHRHAR